MSRLRVTLTSPVFFFFFFFSYPFGGEMESIYHIPRTSTKLDNKKKKYTTYRDCGVEYQLCCQVTTPTGYPELKPVSMPDW